ncbi:MAG: hypothetical protein AAB971_02315 [Patescibacteria group bacterium]
MSLTRQDLNAIQRLIDNSCNRLETSLIKRIDELDDTLSMQMEHGLQEVRDQVNGLRSEMGGLRSEVDGLRSEVGELRSEVGDVKQVVQRTERVLLDEVDRNNQRDKAILKMRKSLHAV